MEEIYKAFNHLMILVENRNETKGDMTLIYEKLEEVSKMIMEADANYND